MDLTTSGVQGADEFPRRDLDEILSATETLWKELAGERILFTGGSGFIGGWMLATLHHANRRLGLGARATVLTRDPELFRRKFPHYAADEVSVHKGDLLTFEMAAESFGFAIHAAAEVAARGTGDISACYRSWKTSATGTDRFLEYCGAAGVRKLLFTSSGAVYGPQPPDLPLVPETFAGAPSTSDPSSVYGEGKRAGELLCAIHGTLLGIECKVARIFATFGPAQPLNGYFAMGNFLSAALAGRPLLIRGDGRPVRSYLYVSDLMIWLWTILFRGMPNEPYNVGSQNVISIRELALHVARAAGRPPGFVETPSLQTKEIDSPPRYVPDTTKARELLGLQVRVGLDEGITRTISWHRARARMGAVEDGEGFLST